MATPQSAGTRLVREFSQSAAVAGLSGDSQSERVPGGGRGGRATAARFRGLFPGVVIRQRRGMKKADFQGISMISGNTKSIPVLGGGRV